MQKYVQIMPLYFFFWKIHILAFRGLVVAQIDSASPSHLSLVALLICLWQPFSQPLAALLIVPHIQHNATLPALLPHLQPLAAVGTTLVTTLL